MAIKWHTKDLIDGSLDNHVQDNIVYYSYMIDWVWHTEPRFIILSRSMEWYDVTGTQTQKAF